MIKELERKAKKSVRWKSKILTQEEINFGKAKAKIWIEIFKRQELLQCLLKLIQLRMKLLK